MSNLWQLHVTSWRGISIGAVHYYPKLERLRHEVRLAAQVERVLTQEDADALTEKDNEFGSVHFAFKAGESTNRFDTEPEAIAAGVAAWRGLAEEGDALVLGDGASDPCEVLEGPRDFKILGNQIWQECEDIGWWEGPETFFKDKIACDRDESLDALIRHWENLIKINGLEYRASGTITYSPGDPLSKTRTIKVKLENDTWRFVEMEDLW